MIWSLISLLSYFVTVSENNTNPKTLQFIQMLMRSSKLRIRILVYVFCWLNYIVTQLYAPTHVRHKTSIIKYQVPIPKWARLSFLQQTRTYGVGESELKMSGKCLEMLRYKCNK